MAGSHHPLLDALLDVVANNTAYKGQVRAHLCTFLCFLQASLHTAWLATNSSVPSSLTMIIRWAFLMSCLRSNRECVCLSHPNTTSIR